MMEVGQNSPSLLGQNSVAKPGRSLGLSGKGIGKLIVVLFGIDYDIHGPDQPYELFRSVSLQGPFAGGTGVPDPQIGRPRDPPGASLALTAGARPCLPLHDGLLRRVASARCPQASAVPGSRPAGSRGRTPIAGCPCSNIPGRRSQAWETPQRPEPADFELHRSDGASRDPDSQHRSPAQGPKRHLHHPGKPHTAANRRLRLDRDRPHACPVNVKTRSETSPINEGCLRSHQ